MTIGQEVIGLNLNFERLKKRIEAAGKQTTADLVIKNGRIIDVFNGEILLGDVAITDGFIVGIGEYEGNHIIDAADRYICPSFIDGHVHIESSMVTPSEYAKVVLPHGVTTVITDPHEIANVSGKEGIEFIIQDSEDIPLDVLLMLPSCVPATPFENSGATLTAQDLEPFFEHRRVLGLAEVMDYPSLHQAKKEMLDKLLTTWKHRSHIDGHLAGLDQTAINTYRAAGISTDHECTTAAEALERLRRGMYVLILEGSAAKNLSALIPVINEQNARRCLFCTDDKHLDDLVENGSIDHNVRLAIQKGIQPIVAIQMASLNAAECYGLSTKGAIAPGYEADFLLLDDLNALTISEVYKGGKLVAKDGIYIGKPMEKETPSPELMETIHTKAISIKDLEIPISDSRKANIIEIVPNQLITKKRLEEVHCEDGHFQPEVSKDLLKLLVIERHKKTGNIGRGIVKGFGLKDGAIATTIAHDSHNIVAAGTNDTDLLKAIHTLQDMNGGLVLVQGGNAVSALSLPIGGLMSTQDYQRIYTELMNMKSRLSDIGFKGSFNPFLTLSFLTLPVIPHLKLTDLGLFDVDTFQHIDV
ncbi:adenine deaminase [Pseudalkalibacillus sp. SCS-8]|uniref:adenine deaminase n=1 Tax=Pseudalkalibacillus nanhaiensis TaxID=3115291 RepID=UPI0039C8ECC5